MKHQVASIAVEEATSALLRAQKRLRENEDQKNQGGAAYRAAVRQMLKRDRLAVQACEQLVAWAKAELADSTRRSR